MKVPAGVDTTRDEVPIPPLKSWQIIPVPPPTLPSSTGPGAAESSADLASSATSGKEPASLSQPSQVSATTGRSNGSGYPASTPKATSASRTSPT